MVKHPRILVVTDNLKDQINGVAITFKHLDAISKLNGFEMHFIDPSEFFNIPFPAYPEVKLAFPFRLGRKIQDIRPDHIHIATEGPIGLAAKLYCDRNNLKYNTSYHTKFPEYLQNLYGIPTNLSYRYMRWFHKHSGVVLTTTKTMKDLLISNGFTGEIKEWSRGVDRSVSVPCIKKEVSDPPTVLFVGRISKEKNLEQLLKLQDQFNVVIVGDGPDRSRLQDKYPRAEFVGYKTGADLFSYYAKADVFCFPSKTDTFGIVIIEALSMGTPVAGYEVAGPIDIIENGVNGYLGEDLASNIKNCLALNREQVLASSEKWTWESCWNIFKDNLQ
jgi:glycosyltransferase involved in cell wall biosynthesis